MEREVLTHRLSRRDIPPEDQYGTGRGQSYRPGGARERTPPPRADTYRAHSPPRRNDFSDSYRAPRARSRTPPRRDDYRRRSPSPGRFRERDARGAASDTYRGRPRSPLRREDLPRDDLFRRESARDTRDYRDERSYRDERDYGNDRGYAAPAARSPPPRYRDRSPTPLKRGREPSPVDSRDRRTPPPAKRERLESPRGRYQDYPPSRPESPPRRRYSPDPQERRPSPRGINREYRPRSRTPPPRSERVDPRAVDDWRRQRSPSPTRYSRQDYLAADENGGRDSNTTSRRSSPPVHPSRMQQVDDRSGRPTPRDPYDSREPYRARSPEPRRPASPLPRERDYSEDRGYASTDDRIPPPREPYRADDVPTPRAPPTGPAGYRAPSSTMAPPTGPSAATVSISAHARAAPVPPSGPRAAGPPRGDFGPPRGRGGFRGDFGGGRGGFGGPPFRGGRGGPAPSYAGRGGPPTGPSFGRSDSFDREAEYSNGPPTGPSSAGAGPPSGPRGSFSQASAAPPPFRQSNNSTATTYPRTQRFGAGGQPIPDASPISDTPTGPRASRADRPHPAIADLPKPIEGGQKAESLVDRTKLDKLQDEAEKLRKAIEEKEARKRKGLREWERLGRETEAAGFRSQLAEEALRNASGEAEAAAAF